MNPFLAAILKDPKLEIVVQGDADAWLVSILGRRFRALSGVVGMMYQTSANAGGVLSCNVRRVKRISNFSADDIQIVTAPYSCRISSRILFHVLQTTVKRFFSLGEQTNGSFVVAKLYALVFEGTSDLRSNLGKIIHDDLLLSRVEGDWQTFAEIFAGQLSHKYQLQFDGDCLSVKFIATTVANQIPDIIASGELGADVVVIHADGLNWEYELIYDVFGPQKLAYAAMVILINSASLRAKKSTDAALENTRKAV